MTGRPQSTLHTRTVLLLAVVAAIALLAGCGVLLSEDPSLPDGDEAAERFRSAGTYEATFVTEFEMGEERQRFEGTIVHRPGTAMQYQELVAGNESTRTVMVSNGSVSWVYREGEDEATRLTTNGEGNRQYGDYIRRLVNRATADGGETERPYVPAVPVAPGSGAGGAGVLQRPVGPATVSYGGVETVAGRDAHVIDIEAAGDAERFFQQTVYFDAETFVMLGNDIEMEVLENRTVMTHRIETITFDVEVADDRFEFDPPADVTVNEGGGIDRAAFDSRAALAEAATIRVPDPDVPEGFTLDRGSRTVLNGTEMLTLEYVSDSETLSVNVFNETSDVFNGSDGEQVAVGDQTGVYTQLGVQGTVMWSCAGNTYAVAGERSKDEMVRVAESVACN